MNFLRIGLLVVFVSCSQDLFAGWCVVVGHSKKKSAKLVKGRVKRKRKHAKIKRVVRRNYANYPTKKDLAEQAKEDKINAECGKIMRDTMKKLYARLARHDKGIFTKKELADRKKQRKIQREIIAMAKAQEKHLASGKVGVLSAKEKRKLRRGLRKMNRSIPDYKTGDEKAEENTNKFDGDIDIDPEDDWDEDPELFGD